MPPLNRRGLMLVLSSPSGAGKSTIARAILAQNPNLKLSISATTRPMRPGEHHGTDYYFISQHEFNTMVEQGDMLEYATVFANKYGTPKKPVEEALNNGQDVMFDIDWQGTQQLTEHSPNDLVRIFILPPSRDELLNRLRTRAQDSEKTIQYRMSQSSNEMSHWVEYDWVIINENLADSIAQVQTILTSERLRRHRQQGISQFIKTLREDHS